MRTEVVLITGAAQGIGLAIARALAHPQRKLLLADLNVGNLTRAAAELKPKCAEVVQFAGDLTEADVQRSVISNILKRFERVDVLINNAGVTHPMMPIEEISDADYDFNFAVNTKLPFQLIKAFLPSMRENRNGLIINMSSAANISGYQNLSVYSATKAALSSLTESVAAENLNSGIKAISILPSRTNTPMQVKVRGSEVAKDSQPPEFVADVIRQIVDSEIRVKTGDDVRIREGKFLVEEDIFSKDFN